MTMQKSAIQVRIEAQLAAPPQPHEDLNVDKKKPIPPSLAQFALEQLPPVKSLYVEVKRDEYESLRARVAELEAERDELRAKVETMRAALRVFVGCAYPVSVAINPRGHNWVERYLDDALESAKAALQAKP